MRTGRMSGILRSRLFYCIVQSLCIQCLDMFHHGILLFLPLIGDSIAHLLSPRKYRFINEASEALPADSVSGCRRKA